MQVEKLLKYGRIYHPKYKGILDASETESNFLECCHNHSETSQLLALFTNISHYQEHY